MAEASVPEGGYCIWTLQDGVWVPEDQCATGYKCGLSPNKGGYVTNQQMQDYIKKYNTSQPVQSRKTVPSTPPKQTESPIPLPCVLAFQSTPETA